MNSSMKKRIEKIEAKTETLRAESVEREAKLLEIERLEEQNPIQALLLKLELELGRKATLVDIIKRAHQAKNGDDR